MARLSLSLLGPLRIALDGQPVSGIAYNKVRALLVYLAVAADRSHQRDALVGLLWPDLPDTAARTNLRQALANLREAIGDASAAPPLLLITRDTIQLNPASDYDLDATTFTTLLATCENHAHRRLEHCRSCAERMEQAIALYHGDFLAEFALGDSAPFEEWHLRQRERLHQQALDALVRLTDYHERRGDDEHARRYAQRQIELEPWREEAHRQLMRLLARGGQRSAALAQYKTCRHILERDLGVEPEAETTALYERIRDGEPRTEPPRQTPLPIPPTPLIGREAELLELGALLENPAHRLITIVGPGGIGKTRLALAAAAEQAEAFTHGAAFVPLAAISSAEFLAPAILGTLDVELQGQRDPRDQLLDYLRGKELLLVLDNLEQLLAPDQSENGGIAEPLSAILARAPGVTFLVTSRERLALPGEWLFDMSGLRYPTGETDNGIEGYSAVRLFMQRARQVRRQFALVDGEAHGVARICRLVEGLPLAIELAASSLRTRSCTAIAEALERNLSALAIEMRAVPERHRSMWAAFEHSWRLLSDEEQKVFPQLSVFRAGFEEDAAAQVAQASPELLTALVDKSLLRWDGMARYDLHELVRQYASEKLGKDEETKAIRQQHAEHYLAVAKKAPTHSWGSQYSIWLDQLEKEHDNLRAALAWSQGNGILDTGMQLTAALAPFWERRGYWGEGRAWTESLLARSKESITSTTLVIALCRQASYLMRRQGDYSQATVLCEEYLASCRELGDMLSIAAALRDLGRLAWLQEEYTRATALYEESLLLSRQLNDRLGATDALSSLGQLAHDQGDDTRARTLLEEGLLVCQSLGSQIDIARALLKLGDFMPKDHIRATALLEESLTLFRQLGHKEGIAESLRILGEVAHVQGDCQHAAARFAESLALYHELGDKHGIAMALLSQGEIARSQRDYSRAEVLYNDSLILHQGLGNKWGIATTLLNLGRVALRHGDSTRATIQLTESLRLFRELKDTEGMVMVLFGLAGVAGRHKQSERAVRLFAASDMLSGVSIAVDLEDHAEYELSLTSIRPQLHEATFAAAWAEGETMTLEQAIAEALEGSGAASVSSVATAAPQ